MTIVPIALPTRSNPSRFGIEGNARLVNVYPETTGQDAKNTSALYGVEGLDTWLTPAAGKVWAMLPTESYLYGVTGTTVWAVDTSDVISTLGSVAIDGPVTMARNRRSPNTQVGLVTATDQKYYTIEGTTLTLNADTDLPPPVAIDVRDGYFILPTTFNRYFITGEDDAANISALDFGKAQRSPDEIKRVVATENEIALMGASSIEWHQNSPSTTASFPFVPVANIELGLLASQALAKLDRTIVWLASDGSVRVMEGYGGPAISTHAVERAVGQVRDPEDIRMFAWNSRKTGHSFVAMTSPKWTWIYDVEEGAWFERRSYGRDNWRVCSAVEWGGRVVAGDDATGELYTLSPDHLNEAGDPLVCEVQTAPVDAFPGGAIINALVLDVIPGVGITSAQDGQNRDPEVMMSWSDDGGATWSTERTAKIGRAGQTNARVQWNRLGIVRRNGRTFRFRISADVAKGFQSAYLDVERLG